MSWSPARRPRVLIAAALLIAAFAIRLAHVETTHYRPVYDAGSYLTLASEIAHTGDYTTSRAPASAAGGTRGPSAYFAPGFPYFLAAADLVSGHTTRRGRAVQSARLEQVVLGTAIVGLIGLVALELFGSTVALTALGVAAVYPVLIELSGILVAENLLTALVLAAVWATLRVGHAQHPYRWIAAAGVLTGLATLGHENGAVIAIPLAFAVWSRRPRLRPAALAAPALLLATAAITIAPWTIRNAVLLHRFIPVSDETGITLLGTYNSASAAYRPVPYKWRFFAAIPGESRVLGNTGHVPEAALGERLLRQALHYLGDHPLSPLVVAYHNTRRMFELEGTFAWRASADAMGIPRSTAGIGVVSFWVLCLLALAGAFTRLVRAAPLWVWAVPVLLALSVVLVNIETPRFREPVDPFLILLASCALVTAAARVRAPAGRRLRGTPVGGDRGAVLAAGPGQLVEMRERLA